MVLHIAYKRILHYKRNKNGKIWADFLKKMDFAENKKRRFGWEAALDCEKFDYL